MQTDKQPSSRRLGKAGVVVVAIVLVMVVTIFVGLNMRNVEEGPATEPAGQQSAPTR